MIYTLGGRLVYTTKQSYTMQRRKRDPAADDDASVALYAPNSQSPAPPKVTLNDTFNDLDTRTIMKNIGFLVLGLAWKLLLITIIIAIIGATLDVHNEWKRASRLAEVEISKAKGTLESSTCKYYLNLLDEDDKRKWEKSAIAETNNKCVEAEIIANQWHLIMKLRMLAHQYLPYESGKFYVFLKDAVFYVVSVLFPVMGFLYKAASWFTPIMKATNTFADV